MPTFNYIALDKDGKRRPGRITAPSKEDALVKLREENLNPLTVEPVKEQVNVEDVFARFQGIKPDSLVYFTRQLATMIDSGMPPIRALAALEEQEENPKFKQIISEIIAKVEAGSMMHEAFAEYPEVFERLYVAMLRAGEESGSLPQALKELANQLEKNARLRKAIKSAMMYPKVILGVAFLILSGLLMTIVPRFAELFEEIVSSTHNPDSGTPPDTSLPALTEFVVKISHLLYPDRERDLMWWGEVGLRFLILFLVIFGIRKLIRYVLRQEGPRRKWDAFKLRAPMRIGPLVQKIVVARFSRTYSSLLSAGVTAPEALEIVADTAGNVLIGEAVLKAREQIMAGSTIAEPLARSEVFPAVVVQMVEVGEETGQLEQMLAKVADFFEEEVDMAIKGLTSLIEPLMILGVGGMIGVVIIAVYLPLFSVYDKVQTTGVIVSSFASDALANLLQIAPF